MMATRQFHQLSLYNDSHSLTQKRKSFRKQFSEDNPDFNNSWFDHGNEIGISLNPRNKNRNKNLINKAPSMKIAWADKNEIQIENVNDESVVIKKINESKRSINGKLTRHGSLEKDSILNSKQDLTERLRFRNPNNTKEYEKFENRTNLKIILTHNTKDQNEDQESKTSEVQDAVDHKSSSNITQPKFRQPLVANLLQEKAFQIKKSKKSIDSPKAMDINEKRQNFSRSNTIVVVPLIEKEESERDISNNTKDCDSKLNNNNAVNGINVIIRPVTAQTKREKFQKGTNSAFHGTSNERPQNFRPPLVRSSSAPCTKPEKSKFLATRRKLKNFKKTNNSPKEENKFVKNVESQEWKNAAPSNPEIVTMVSLISPSGSDNEHCSDEETIERPKSVLKKDNGNMEKTLNGAKEEKATKDISKPISLRKTVKSVSFQQSTIHAIRSFSASFPARRGSMATALTLGSTNNNSSNKNQTVSKTHEKRGTNPNAPDADERVPKRRLVRSNTEEAKLSTWQQESTEAKRPIVTKSQDSSSNIIDVQTKSKNQVSDPLLDLSLKLDLEENATSINTDQQIEEVSRQPKEEIINDTPAHDTPKEKQCWAMYCKMTEKGINVSYDTILRGMLTPTEYRMRKKPSIAEEMAMLVNPASSENPPRSNENLISK